jgi:sulfatase maturation enzyme AslB (radical SAM superfamily)
MSNSYVHGQVHALDSVNMQKCSGCQFARYCSTDCQRDDWRASGGNHRAMCQSIGQAFIGHVERREHRQVYYGLLTEERYTAWQNMLAAW